MKIKNHDNQFFYLEDGTRIAKAGLRPSTMQKWVQHFADGGEVKPSKSEPPAGDAALYADATGSGPDSGNLPFASTDFPVQPEAPAQEGAMSNPPAAILGGLANAIFGAGLHNPSQTGEAQANQAKAKEQAASAKTADEQAQASDQVSQQAIPQQPMTPEQASSVVAQQATQGQAQKAAANSQYAANMRHSGQGMAAQPGPYHDEIQAATDLMIKGKMLEADSAAAQAKANEVATEAMIKQQQQIQEKYTKQFEDNQARSEALRQQILNNPIDANRLWNNTSTAGQMSTLVAMSLGGVAGAMSGRGGNQVLDLVNRAIDRDLQAQEANLGAKQGVLNNYLQNGMQIQQARQLAKADSLSLYGAQLEANAYKMAPGAIQAQALQQVGAVMQQAQQLRLNVAETGAKVELMRAQAQGAYMENTLKKMELNWLRGQGGYGGVMGGGTPGQPGPAGGYLNEYMKMKVMGPEYLKGETPFGHTYSDEVNKQATNVATAAPAIQRSLDYLNAHPAHMLDTRMLGGTLSGAASEYNSQLAQLRANIGAMAQSAPPKVREKLLSMEVPKDYKAAATPGGRAQLQSIQQMLLGTMQDTRRLVGQ